MLPPDRLEIKFYNNGIDDTMYGSSLKVGNLEHNMKENKMPLFEAYVSIDIPNPLNSEIYEIRDCLSDKKMTAMPVDLPLFGHFDGDMTLIRNINELSELMDAVLDEIERMNFDEAAYLVKTDHFEVTENGQLILVMHPNKIITSFMQLIQSKAEERNLESLLNIKSTQNSLLKSKDSPILYVMLKTHLPLSKIEEYNGKSHNAEFHLERLTLYHKEAIPLTRVQSWYLRE